MDRLTDDEKLTTDKIMKSIDILMGNKSAALELHYWNWIMESTNGYYVFEFYGLLFGVLMPANKRGDWNWDFCIVF